jgi:hypothetical protein
MFWVLLDPDPYPQLICTDPGLALAPDPYPSMDKEKNEENLDIYCFVTFFDF